MIPCQIRHQLIADCHQVGRFEHCHLLLHRNASVPWFILVPETEITDLFDSPEEPRNRALHEASLVSSFIKRELNYPKFNFAGIGNAVPQLHLHVIGRRADDPCWPAPIWGHLIVSREYSAARLREICDLSARRYQVVPAAYV
jgi:diadenosine tetraphosphate (Ap4A) HIT family hydrolase